MDVEEAAEYFVNREFHKEVAEFVSNKANRQAVYGELLERFEYKWSDLFLLEFPF